MEVTEEMIDRELHDAQRLIAAAPDGFAGMVIMAGALSVVGRADPTPWIGRVRDDIRKVLEAGDIDKQVPVAIQLAATMKDRYGKHIE